MESLVIAYVPINPGKPARAIGKFYLDDELKVPVWHLRRFDPANRQDMNDLFAAQKEVARSPVYNVGGSSRVCVMPASYFGARVADHIASQAEAARVNDESLAASRRLAELAASAPATPPAPSAPSPADDWRDPEPVTPAVEEPIIAAEPVAEEIPPYTEWSLDELRAEVAERKLKAPKKKDQEDPAAWIAVLEADDAADGVE